MEDQGQGWLRGAIIAGAVAAVGVYLMSRGDESGGATGSAGATATGGIGAALAALGSSEVGQRGGRIIQLLLGNASDQALAQVKSTLKDAVRQLDGLVDEM